MMKVSCLRWEPEPTCVGDYSLDTILSQIIFFNQPVCFQTIGGFS